MNKRLGGYVVLVAVISLLFAGCGRDHGDDADLSAASSVTVNADKEFALANSSEKIGTQIGSILLGTWLVAGGLVSLFHVHFAGSGVILAVLGVAAGVMVLITRH